MQLHGEFPEQAAISSVVRAVGKEKGDIFHLSILHQ